MRSYKLFMLCLFPILLSAQAAEENALLTQVEHGYADNDGVKIHYVSIGEGPLVVMLHGFPDYWYTWRDQMMALKDRFRVVAMDLRAYNLSDQPRGVDAYKMSNLVDDVIAVIKAQGEEKAIIVGHDWGGAIAWQLAIYHPDMVEKLIVCNMTHPTGRSRVALQTLQANENTSYMDDFRKQTAATLPISWMTGWVRDSVARKEYKRAFGRSYVDGMINYYKANTSTKEARAKWLADPTIKTLPKIEVPVLVIFGTQDQYVQKEGLNDSWDFMQKDLTLVTLPEAGHFVQQDASEMVSRTMRMWLLRDDN